eukprot:scaffold141001_cov24-Tisochrysis_lutea.AAC.1
MAVCRRYLSASAAAGGQPSWMACQVCLPEALWATQATTPCATCKLPFERAPTDDRSLPDLQLALYNDVVVFDQVLMA